MPGRDYGDPEHELWELGSYGSAQWSSSDSAARRKPSFVRVWTWSNQLGDRSIYDIISLLGLMGEASVTQMIWSKLGEAAGRFIDYPFLDPELLGFAYSTSWEAKLREPKALVRGALRQLDVPEFIIQRPKSSFGINIHGWALKGGIFEPLVPLAAKVVPERDLRSLHSDDWPKASIFWALINYGIWKRLCVNGEPLESLEEELKHEMSGSEVMHMAEAEAACLNS